MAVLSVGTDHAIQPVTFPARDVVTVEASSLVLPRMVAAQFGFVALAPFKRSTEAKQSGQEFGPSLHRPLMCWRATLSRGPRAGLPGRGTPTSCLAASSAKKGENSDIRGSAKLPFPSNPLRDRLAANKGKIIPP
jgi:hypothetical protein